MKTAKNSQDLLSSTLQKLPTKERKDLVWLLRHPDFEEKPVSIREFIDSPLYLGLKEQCRRKLKDELEKVFGTEKGMEQRLDIKSCAKKLGRVNYALFTGGIGIGKTFITGVGFSYMIYRLLILKNPQKFYGLAPGTRMAIMEMSTSGQQALNVIFSEIKARVENSSWFMNRYPYDPNFTNQLRFKKNVFVIPGDSQETTFEGYNIIAGAIDELDSHKKTATKDYAQVGFETIDVRITSRFHKNGLLFLLGSMKSATGSANYFLHQLRKRSDANVSRLAIWESRNSEDYCGKKFYFDVNNKIIVSHKIGNTIEIPVEYIDDFRTNPDKAMRDLAGIPPYAQQPFFSMAEKVKNGYSSYDNPINEYGGLIESFRAVDDKKRIIHVDLGINKDGGDACGVVMGHIDSFKEIEGGQKPVIKIDFMTELKAPPGGEIMISDIRLLIYELIDRGFKIFRVTYDSWNSTESLQALRKRRIPAKLLSIDKDTAPYESLKETMYEGRLIYPNYLPFIDECIQLEYIEGGKIDHPPKGCFTGDTRIALLDGTCPSFYELKERFGERQKFAVYSMSPNGVTIGWANNSRVTRENAELIEIMLDNYQVIRCTPDHLFMTLGGGWIRAEDLIRDIGIVPLYRAISYNGGYEGYERLWCPIKKQRILTHRMVESELLGDIDDYIVHHRDGNKSNNHPDNLLLFNKAEHHSLHTKDRYKNDPGWVKKLRRGHELYRINGGNEKSRLNILKLFKEGKLKLGRNKCLIRDCNDLADVHGLCEKHYQRIRRLRIKSERTSMQVNHRILYVKKLNVKEDVWDITVPKYHNFALSSGVFVHNSKDVSDAAAGVVFNLVTSAAARPQQVVRSYLGEKSLLAKIGGLNAPQEIKL